MGNGLRCVRDAVFEIEMVRSGSRTEAEKAPKRMPHKDTKENKTVDLGWSETRGKERGPNFGGKPKIHARQAMRNRDARHRSEVSGKNCLSTASANQSFQQKHNKTPQKINRRRRHATTVERTSMKNNHRTSLARSAAFSIRPAQVTVMEVSRHGVAASSVHAPAPGERESPCLLLALLSSTRSARSMLSKTAPAASPAAAVHTTLFPGLSDHLVDCFCVVPHRFRGDGTTPQQRWGRRGGATVTARGATDCG